MKVSQDFTWQSPDGLQMYGYHWQATSPRAVVVLVHGLGEHCRRYDHMAAYFNQHQIAMLGYDRRGHGNSEGKRGHTHSFDDWMEEIDHVLAIARQSYPQLPVFLYGHSMGGNLVLNYTLRNSTVLAGTIASGPWIKLVNEPSPLLVALGRVMTKIYPAFSQKNGIAPEQISSDPVEVRKYATDPLVHDQISAAAGTAMLDAAAWLENYTGQNLVPILLMAGAADSIVSPESVKIMRSGLTGTASVKIWPGMFHEIHNEPAKEKVFEEVVAWMMRIKEKS